MRPVSASRDISRLLEIMDALRDPVSGCAWDQVQTFSSIAPYTIEEAYEVAEAIARGDMPDLRDELGDLLLQVVFHAAMARDEKAFDFGDVVEAICAKMIRRHPHVFGDAGDMTQAQISAQWGAIKAQEKAARAARDGVMPGLLDSVKSGQPALTRAVRLQDKASSVGFDWNDARAVLAKIREETDEIEQALDAADADNLAEEIGDLLFIIANLARHANVDPETATRNANAKFEARFGYIERALSAQGRTLDQASLPEMEALWLAAKAASKEG